MDTTLVIFGIALFAFGLVMLLAYLWLERGSFLDPVAVSWAGYLVFIPIAMIGTGVLYPDRDTSSYGLMGCGLMVLGTIAYTFGLYCGKAVRFTRYLPSPRDYFSKTQIWIALLISAAVLPALPLAWEPLVAIAGGSAGTVLYDAMFSITLISVIGVVMLRGSPISRIAMAGVAVAASFAILWTIWSRRPLIGVVIAAVGLFYHFRLSRSAKIKKLWYFGALSVAALIMILYLDATRGERFYGRAGASHFSPFSAEGFRMTFGGVEMNYRVYEFALQQFPSQHRFLYGSGYVPGLIWFPRAIWTSKPNGTGYVVSQVWFGQEVLSTNLGLPTMGEAYVNFGVIGVILVLFLIGRVVRILNTYLYVHYNNVIAWAAWLMIIPDIATEWRGDFTSMTSQALLRVIGFLAVTWLSGKLAPVPKDRRLAPNRIGSASGRVPGTWPSVRPLMLPQQGSMFKPRS